MLRKVLLPALPLLVAFGAWVVSYFCAHPMQGGMFNSDALYLPTLFRDVLGDSGHMADWYLTPAPYFFPDYFLFALAYAVGDGAYQQVLIFSLLQLALLFAAIWFLMRRARVELAFPAASLTLTLLLWAAMRPEGDPYVYLLYSAHHTGVLICGLLLMALWLPALEGERLGKGALAAAVGLAFAATLSDNLFVIQALLPLLGMALIQALITHRWRPQTLVLLPLAGGVLGNAAYPLCVSHITRYKPGLSLKHTQANLHALGNIAKHVWVTAPLMAVTLAVCLMFALYCLQALLRRRVPTQLPLAVVWLSVFWLLSLAANSLILLFVKDFDPAGRHLLPLFCLPPVLGVLLAARISGRWFRPAALAISAMAAGICVLVALHLVQVLGFRQLYYPEKLACLDRAVGEAGVRRGISQYWDAKYYQAFSHQPVIMAAHRGTLARYRWITSEAVFAEAYAFAIIGESGEPLYKLPKERLIALNGEPAKTVHCEDFTLLIWGPGQLHIPDVPEEKSKKRKKPPLWKRLLIHIPAGGGSPNTTK